MNVWLLNLLAEEIMEEALRGPVRLIGSVRERVEELIVQLFAAQATQRADGSLRLTADIRVNELARFVQASREPVSRCLSDLACDRLLFREQGWFVMPPASRLLDRVRSCQQSRAVVTFGHA